MASISIDRNGFLANVFLARKGPCRAGTTAAVTLSGEQTIDGVAVVAEDRVLVKNQSSGIDNGIYIVKSSTWERADDLNRRGHATRGTTVFVTDGTTNALTEWVVTTTGDPVPGQEAISFSLLGSGTGFDTFAHAEAAVIPLVQMVIRTNGYHAAGDLGGALYKRVGSEPVHPGKLQTADGAWWEIAEETINPQMLGAVADGVSDDTVEIQAALDASLVVSFPPDTYLISNHLTTRDNHKVILGPGVRIIQATASTRIFFNNAVDNVWIFANGAVLEGEGTYDGNLGGSWTGNGGHEDRAIEYFQCVGGGVTYPVIENCGNSGIAIIDSQWQKIIVPKITGTGTVTSQGNFQNGIMIRNVAAVCDDITIIAPDIAGVAQGILDECFPSLDYSDRHIAVLNPNIHDIPGQHGFYLQGSGLAITSPILNNIELDGVKVQLSNSVSIARVHVTGIVGKDIGGNFINVSRTGGTGTISDVRMTGVVDNANRALSLGGPVARSHFEVVGTNITGSGVNIAGSDVDDVDVHVTLSEVGDDGVLVTSTTSDNIRIRAVIRNPDINNTVVGASGIRVNSASANVELFDPVVTDANTRMQYGLFNAILGSIVKVRGSAVFTGASDRAVRATGVISEWPTEVTLQGANGDFTTPSRVRSQQAMQSLITSTTASNVVLWSRELDDETAYMIKAEIAGRLSGSAQRAGYVSAVLVYRDGGAAVIEGTPDEVANTTSVSFLGVYAWAATGNEIQLRVNSGGTADYFWRARVTVTPV